MGSLSWPTEVLLMTLSGRKSETRCTVCKCTLWKELCFASQPHFPASRSTRIVQADTKIKVTSLWCGQPGLESCRETERKTTWQWGWTSLVSKFYRKKKSDRLAVTWPLSQVFACGKKICILRPKGIHFSGSLTSSLACPGEMTTHQWAHLCSSVCTLILSTSNLVFSLSGFHHSQVFRIRIGDRRQQKTVLKTHSKPHTQDQGHKTKHRSMSWLKPCSMSFDTFYGVITLSKWTMSYLCV